MFAAMVVMGVGACAPAMRPDAGQDAAAEASATMDAAADSATDARREAGSRDAAAVDDAEAVDVVINPGMCGQAVRDCLCGCGANATCQQGCVQGDPNCSDCLFTALTMCCPMENTALEHCIIENDCETDACILSMCGAQWNALQSCARRRESEPACLMHVQACLGPDYPSVQCLRDQ
jgi:hypothetical protein